MKILQISGMALGTQVELIVASSTEEKASEMLQELWNDVLDFEKRYSRFLPKSELSDFNRSAGLNCLVTPEFRNLLETAKALAERSNGLFNPFVLPALQRNGYKNSRVKGYEADYVDDYSDRKIVDTSSLIIDKTWARIPKDTAIDFGGFGKGYLADKLATKLQSRGETNHCLSLGGDIACEGFDQFGNPWRVGVEHARGSGENCAHISTTGERVGIATSSTVKRAGSSQGKAWHHIINPSTLEPAETDILSATIMASTTLDADVLASNVIIAGSKGAKAAMDSFGVNEGFLQLKNSRTLNFGRSIIEDIKVAHV